MRPIERIPVFLELIKGKFIDIIFNIYNIGDKETEEWNNLYEQYNTNLTNFYYDNEIKLKEYWLENSDLRFSQVLIALRIIPNIPGFWFYIEDYEILEKLGIPSREYLLWGQNYDKDMNLLPKTIYKPIKDLSIDHIKAILNGNFCKSEKYKKCFEEELKLRENDNT